MKSSLFFLFLVQTVSIFCASLELDDQVIQGSLPNGLTYYVRENKFPADRTSLKLVVKVGSIYEKEGEEGIAHFIEHLVFRGTKHWADGEIFHYLESIGAETGADTNAYTSFETTVFQIEIPVDKDRAIFNGLHILSDLAGSATLSPQSIDKERNVVLDELYQSYSSPDRRFNEHLLNELLPDSPFAGNNVIGLEKVIKEITPEELRAFYKRWYRPDRMALVAVGDFKAEEVVKNIEGCFGVLSNPDEPLELPSMETNYTHEKKAFSYFDKELDHTSVLMVSFYPIPSYSPLEDWAKERFLSTMYCHLLNERLNRLRLGDSLFLSAACRDGSFGNSMNLFYFVADLVEGRALEGVKVLHEEIERAKKWGFNEEEWEKLTKLVKESHERAIEQIGKLSHSIHVAKCVDHFLKGKPILTEESILKRNMEFGKELTVSDLNSYLPFSRLYDPFLISLNTPSLELYQHVLPSDVLNIVSEEGTLPPYASSTSPVLHLEPKFPSGKIVDIKENKNTGVVYLNLSNGIRLALKKTDFEKGEVQLTAQARGGLASVAEEDLASAALSLFPFSSGLEGVSYPDYFELLESKGIAFQPGLSFGKRSIHSGSRTQDLEIVFQLLHAFFTAPLFDEKAWDRQLAFALEKRKQELQDPNTQFDQFVNEVNYQGYFCFKTLDFSQVEREKAAKLFDRFFGVPQEFTFVLTGDFDGPVVEKLAEKYLASLPIRGEKSSLLSFSNLFPEKVVHEEFRAGNNSFVTALITIPYDLEGGIEQFGNAYSFDALCKVLKKRLRNVLRFELGGTYGVRVRSEVPFSPNFQNASVQISLTCQESCRKEMVSHVFQEIEKLKAAPPTKEEIQTIQALLDESHKGQIISNDYWLDRIAFAELKQLPLEKLLDDFLEKEYLTTESLQKAADWMFASPYHSVIYHLPELEQGLNVVDERFKLINYSLILSSNKKT